MISFLNSDHVFFVLEEYSLVFNDLIQMVECFCFVPFECVSNDSFSIYRLIYLSLRFLKFILTNINYKVIK